MTAILTHSKQSKNGHAITAVSPSGKRRCITIKGTPLFQDHQMAAESLAARIGVPLPLAYGETREGFAFIPAANPPISLESVEKAARVLMEAAQAFPSGEKDPIRLASGIMELVKRK